MREMKASGISWLGELPSNWELRKIKYCLQERVEKNNPVRTTEILSLTAKQGVIPYDQKEGGGNKPKEDVSAYRLAYPGDIVMNSMNILSGSVGLSQYFGCVSPVYYMLRPWNAKEDVRYYNYIFQTTMFQRSLFGLGNGILIECAFRWISLAAFLYRLLQQVSSTALPIFSMLNALKLMC